MELGIGDHRGRRSSNIRSIRSTTGDPEVPPGDPPKIASPRAKHGRRFRRLTAVKRDASSLLAVSLRTGLMVGLAVLLILVLLPAAIGAQAATLR
jgi:hypothetical protein